MLKFSKIAAMILSACIFAGCGESGVVPGTQGDGMVSMVLSVATVDSREPARSRADETYFEELTSHYERINTLRLIIVRPDGRVEHNRLIRTAMADQGVDYHNNMVFKVLGGEKKDIWLIANEASVPGYDFGRFVTGAPLDVAALEAITLKTSAAGAPLFDNSDAAADRHYLPMAEHFAGVDVKLPSPATDGPTYQYETLFITRSTVKFTLSAKVDPPSYSNITLKKIVFNNIGDTQYLFPKNTEYSPSKFPLSGANRLITAYDVPEGAATAPLSFDVNWNFPPLSSAGKTASPALYFPETKIDGKYTATVTVEVDGTDFEYTAQLPNLPSLPRNTHVRIDMVFTGHSVQCQVDLAQYIGVILKPDFGFEELHPNQQ